MPLFQSSVVDKYLKTLDKEVLDVAYAKFRAHFHNPVIRENIRNSKEEQYLDGGGDSDCGGRVVSQKSYAMVNSALSKYNLNVLKALRGTSCLLRVASCNL